MPMSIDPVCGKTVDEENAPSETFRGREYFFCSEECLKRFQSNPEQYVDIAA